MSTSPENQWKEQRPQMALGFAALLFAGCMLLAYFGTMTTLVGNWWTNEDYQHGFFVLPFAVFLLYYRRGMMFSLPIKGTWWGLAFFVLAALMRWISVYFAIRVFEPLSLIPLFTGLTILLGGWRALLWAWPAIAFLVFIIRLPTVVEIGLRYPLQRIGTTVSVFLIQTMGIPAIAQGNVIQLAGGPIEVAQACSGLRMMMLFFAVCAGGALVIRGPLWEKVVAVLSAVPIAIFSNVARITITAVLHELVSPELSEKLFHGMAGLLMMPIGLALLLGELALLRKLLEPSRPEAPLTLGGAFPGMPGMPGMPVGPAPAAKKPARKAKSRA
jgi:exosortase